jgi:signal transduction histidine kinase/ActR/RegA family two-component response regulator
MWPILRRYAFALAMGVIAVAAGILLRIPPGADLYALPVVAVLLAAWYGGPFPGLVSTAVSAAGTAIVLLQADALTLERPDEAVRLVVFVLIGVAASLLVGYAYRSEARARALAAREEEARRDAERRVEEFRRTLAERERESRRQELTFAVTRILAEAVSFESAAPSLLEAVGTSAGWSFGAAWQMDFASGALRCIAAWNDPRKPAAVFEEETRRRLFAPGVGLPGVVWSRASALWVKDVSEAPDYSRSESAARDGLHAACAVPVLHRSRSAAVFEFYGREALDEDAGFLKSLQDLAGRLGQFVERRHVEQRLRILSETSSVLGASLDYETTLSHMARLVVPTLAEVCAIDLVEENGSLRRVALGTVDAGRERAREVLCDEILDPEESRPLLEVVRTGRPAILPRLPIGLLRVLARSDAGFQALKEGGPQTGLSVPLATRGKTLGVLSLASLDPARLREPEEVLLAEELGRRCAVAVDNARLFREAQKASEEKTRFLGAVSHDLRTPVNAIMLLSTLVRRQAESLGDPRSGELVDRCRRLESASRSLTDLLANLLDMTYLDAGEKKMSDEEFSLAELLTETVSTLGSVARAKGLGLRSRPPRPDLLVRADRTELGRVLTNLVGNALKFTVNGSVSVEAERDGEGRVEIAVSDTGPGIPPEQLPNIFDEFFQVRNPERDRAAGSGLGLAIARRIMGALGGDLKVESVVGRGSVFTSVLPAERVVRMLEGKETGLAGSGSRRTGIASILVVDDDLVAAEALAEVLREEDYRASVAPSGEEAIRRLGEEAADLVLLDMMMPGLDGVEVIRRLREGADPAGPRIIAVTGDVTPERIEAVNAAGADGFVRKPVRLAELLQTIRLTLDREGSRSNGARLDPPAPVA